MTELACLFFEYPSYLQLKQRNFFSAVREGNIDVVNRYLIDGININVMDQYNNTALHIASRVGHNEIVQLLISRGAIVDAMNQYNHTALYVAAAEGHKEIAQFLINRGANINYIYKDSITALHSAVMSRHYDTVKLLLYNKADPNMSNDKECSPMSSAIWNGDKGMLKLLSDNGAKVDSSLIHSAVDAIVDNRTGCEFLEWLLVNYKDNIDPFAIDELGREPRDILDDHHWLLAEAYDGILRKLGYRIVQKT